MAIGLVFGSLIRIFICSFSTKKKYTFFLSHHKKAAAVFARQMKMMIEHIQPTATCFLDVDELARLDALAIAVRSDTEHLLVIVTDEVFSRLWCALEVAVAHKNDLSIIPLVCYNDHHNVCVTAEEGIALQQVLPLCIPVVGPDFWSVQQQREFRKSGINPTAVKDAYEDLRTYTLVRSVRVIGSGHSKMFCTMPLCNPAPGAVNQQRDATRVMISIAKAKVL
jgi:hypothetical protein